MQCAFSRCLTAGAAAVVLVNSALAAAISLQCQSGAPPCYLFGLRGGPPSAEDPEAYATRAAIAPGMYPAYRFEPIQPDLLPPIDSDGDGNIPLTEQISSYMSSPMDFPNQPAPTMVTL